MTAASRLRWALFFAPLVIVSAAASGGRANETALASPRHIATVQRVLERTPLVDGHNDLAEQFRDRVRDHVDSLDLGTDTGQLRPPMQTDIARLRRGGVGGIFFAAYVPYELSGPAAVATMFDQMDVIQLVAKRYPETFLLAVSADEIERAHRSGKIAALTGVEGGHAIGNSLPILRQAYQCGARYLTLTHLKSNDWADAAIWPGVGADSLRHGGLTAFGREVIREMNRLGMLVDLSHTADATMVAALEVSEAPVIFSHSGARAVCDHPRNVPDEVLRRLAANGGLVMVDFVPSFTTNAYRDWHATSAAEGQRLEKLHPKDPRTVEAAFETWKAAHPAPRVTLAHVADHIDHVRRVAGIDHAGIGTDFEGASAFPVGLEDTACYPALFVELLRRGYSADEIGKVAGGNLLRVLHRAEDVARRLQTTRSPSELRIEEIDAPSSLPADNRSRP